MAKAIDLRGVQFSRLFSLRRVKTEKGGRWYCLCACGGRSLVTTTALTSGKTKSCGCLRHEVLAAARMERRRWSIAAGPVGRADTLATDEMLEFKEGLSEAIRYLWTNGRSI